MKSEEKVSPWWDGKAAFTFSEMFISLPQASTPTHGKLQLFSSLFLLFLLLI